MWVDTYVEYILIRERIAEAQRDGARQQLLRSTRPATAQRRPWAVLQHVVEAISSLRLKGRKERMAVR